MSESLSSGVSQICTVKYWQILFSQNNRTQLIKLKTEKMPYFGNAKRYCKNSNGFELQGPSGTTTTIREKKKFQALVG